MTTTRESLNLYGGPAKQFRQLREEIAEARGYDVPEDVQKPRVFEHLLEHYDGPYLEE
jgi:hypothetical protein